jgi:hypothetical protein
MNISKIGLVLALIYLAFPAYRMFIVVREHSYGGFFSKESWLYYVTMPGSILTEVIFRQNNFGRMAIYTVSALVNAVIIYWITAGLAKLIGKIFS